MFIIKKWYNIQGILTNVTLDGQIIDDWIQCGLCSKLIISMTRRARRWNNFSVCLFYPTKTKFRNFLELFTARIYIIFIISFEGIYKNSTADIGEFHMHFIFLVVFLHYIFFQSLTF